jgi:AcrR family transcriptional regulator
MTTPSPVRRRDLQKDQTRLDLALAAFELARQHGLAGARVPQIAAATGVSTRTFNNYFPSKEAAIAWPATRRGTMLAASLAGCRGIPRRRAGRGRGQPVPARRDGRPALGWLRDFRALVTAEEDLEPQVPAAVVTGAERAGVLYWVRRAQGSATLEDTVRGAVAMAVRGLAS